MEKNIKLMKQGGGLKIQILIYWEARVSSMFLTACTENKLLQKTMSKKKNK